MPTDTLDQTFAAIADPTRRAILSRLMAGEATVTELAQPFDMSMPAITKHLQVLERAGLLTRSRDAQRRPCRLRPEGLQLAAVWIEAYRELWEQRLDRMVTYVEQLHRAQAKPAPRARSKRTRTPKP